MDMQIDGLRVMVSAGAAGIGREIARAFVRDGAKVHVCDVDTQALQALAKSDPAITTSACDVSDRAQVARFFDEGLAKLGGLDCMVNNAGIAGPTGRVEEIDPCRMGPLHRDRPHRSVQLRAPRGAAPAQVEERQHGERLVPRRTGGIRAPHPLCVVEVGRGGLYEVAAIELGDAGIRVNALLPGLVAGERQKRVLTAKAKARGISYEEMEGVAFSYTSIKEYVTAEQLADLVVFVASPRGKTISGQALSVCGNTQMLG
jgi:NAD(P)-dependent dehydrogenase (short-subunit alcohol dehydrogenase family)